MAHPFKHFILISKHRHRVIRNAAHLGIFFHALKHDLTKYGPTEFITSSKYYEGHHSPVFEERLSNNYFSKVCQHHTKRNAHHWEYWTDFFNGRILAKRMPYKYALEYVADVLSASYTYNPTKFNKDTAYNYFTNKKDHYFMNNASKEFITYCLKQYSIDGFKNLKKKNTKKIYEEIAKKYPEVEMINTSLSVLPLPELKKK